MIADEQVTTEPSSLFSAQDQAAIRAQLKKRLILVLIPVLALLGAAIYFAIQRNEAATDVLTIVSLSVLIFCYDLFLKPLRCYQRHLDNVFSGRRRAVACRAGAAARMHHFHPAGAAHLPHLA